MFDQESFNPGRRRSVDVGGLSLALENRGLGHGWGGWEEREMNDTGPKYAQLLSEMRRQTLLAVNESYDQSPPMSSTVPNDTRRRLIKSLSTWNFEPHKLPDEEVFSCALILFEALFRIEGMEADVGVSLKSLPTFLNHLRKIYRVQNSYHNFIHALDVLQASQTFLCGAGMVPPITILLESDGRLWRPRRAHNRNQLIDCLCNRDLFAVYIAAIGHDVGHPGFTNGFMKNAKTPLSLVYNDQSALEQMHCTLLMHLMRSDGLGYLLDCPETGTHFRHLLLKTVLATDMSLHFPFMDNLRSLVEGKEVDESLRKIWICQALLKCADISNPSRPHRVSQYWASALMQEWTCQASLEEYFNLPSTVHPSSDPLSEARSQVWFINTFAKPLLELTASAIPQMQEYAEQCGANLKLWESISHDLTSNTTTTPNPNPPKSTPGDHHPCIPTSPRPEDFLTVFPLTLPPSFLTCHEFQVPIPWDPAAYSKNPNMTSPSEASSSSSQSQSSGRDISSPYLFPSAPASPTESVGSSFVLSPFVEPHTHASVHTRTLSSSGSSVGGSGATTGLGAIDALRAAYQASVRKKTSRSFHRNSWNVGVGMSMASVVESPSSASRTRVALLVSAASASAAASSSPVPPPAAIADET